MRVVCVCLEFLHPKKFLQEKINGKTHLLFFDKSARFLQGSSLGLPTWPPRNIPKFYFIFLLVENNAVEELRRRVLLNDVKLMTCFFYSYMLPTWGNPGCWSVFYKTREDSIYCGAMGCLVFSSPGFFTADVLPAGFSPLGLFPAAVFPALSFPR